MTGRKRCVVVTYWHPAELTIELRRLPGKMLMIPWNMVQKPLYTSAPDVSRLMRNSAEAMACLFITYRNYARWRLGKNRLLADASCFKRGCTQLYANSLPLSSSGWPAQTPGFFLRSTELPSPSRRAVSTIPYGDTNININLSFRALNPGKKG